METPLKRYAGLHGFNDFADAILLSPEEKEKYSLALKGSYMPFLVTDHYRTLINNQREPYRSQLINIVLPYIGEKNFIGRFDPYGNKSYRQDETHYLQHKYEKTLLLHIDNFCISNCQFCYKVNEIRHEKPKEATINEKVDMALIYIEKHPEIDNVLFTGGDPAAFRKTKQLISLIRRLIEHKNIRTVRFATKGLSFNPERFLDEELLDFFSHINKIEGKQICIIAQINHPAEIDNKSRQAIKELQSTGIQIRGQPAIIKGVNDSIETLIALQRDYLDNNIISYYLTVFMPVRGVEQYGLRLHEAFINVAESKRNLSGLEKKGVLLTSHDFGKFEISGFYPSPEDPKKIILKWHEAAMPEYLPKRLKETIPSRPEDLLILNYNSENMYCIDHVFKENNLPYFNQNNEIVDNLSN